MINDTAAERAVLAGIFRYGNKAYVEISDIISSQSFTIDSNLVIWKCMEHILKDNAEYIPDMPSILSAANSLSLQDFFSSNEKEHLRAIQNFPIDLSNIRPLAIKIKKLQTAREIKEKLDLAGIKLEKITGEEAIEEIISIPETAVLDYTASLSSTSDGNPVKIGEDIEEYVEHVAANPVSSVGILTGMPGFDDAIGGGLRPGVSIIAARPKAGKTMCADNIGMFIASSEIPVLNLDTEMGNIDHKNRMLANISNVKTNDIERGLFGSDKEKLERVRKAAKAIKNLPYEHLSIPGMSQDEVLSIMRRWILKKVGLNANGKANPCVVIYDYIKLTNPEILKNMQENQALGFLMSSLHNFTVKYDVPILAFCQLNRDGINVEDSSGLSQSDRILWLCTSLSYLKKQSEEEMAEQPRGEKYNRKLVVIDCRYGGGCQDGDFINMKAEYEYGRLSSGPTRLELLKKQNKEGFSQAGVNETTF